MKDINQDLLKRKIRKINLQKNKKLKTKRKFKKLKQFEQEKKDDIQDSKTQKQINFYEKIFQTNDNDQVDQNKQQSQGQKPIPYKAKKIQPEQKNQFQKSNKEKKLIKNMYTQKNKKGQPKMKNQINYLLYKINKQVRSQ